MRFTEAIIAGISAKTCLAAAGTQLHGDWYTDVKLSADETQVIFEVQLTETSWILYYLGSEDANGAGERWVVQGNSAGPNVLDFNAAGVSIVL